MHQNQGQDKQQQQVYAVSNPAYSVGPNQNVPGYDPQSPQTTPYSAGQQGTNTTVIYQQPQQVERSDEYSCQLICNLVLGILVMVLCCNWLCGIPAVILAALGLQSPAKRFRRDMNIGAWVLNIVAIVLLVASIITIVVLVVTGYFEAASPKFYYYQCLDEYDVFGYPIYKTCLLKK